MDIQPRDRDETRSAGSGVGRVCQAVPLRCRTLVTGRVSARAQDRVPGRAEREHLGEWNYLQTFKPFAADLMLSPERVRYMQQINLDFKIQNEMLPFERVVDLSLAQDALKLLA